MEHIVRCLITSICLVFVSACSQPSSLLPYELDIPMQVLGVPGVPPVSDGRALFRELFCAELAVDPDFADEDCNSYLHRLADEPILSGEVMAPAHDLGLKIVIVPGLFSDCIANFSRPFETSGEALALAGVEMDYLQVSGRSSSEANAGTIADFVGALELQPGQKLVLVGHSKGAVDILQFLVSFPDLARRVSAVLSVAGAINGSPRADNAYEDYQNWLADVNLDACPVGDGLAMEDLTRRNRMNWLAGNRLPEFVRYYSMSAFVNQDDVGLNSLRGYRALARIDPRNDGQLLFYDQVIPGAVLLAYLNASHWNVAVPVTETHPMTKTVITHNRFPRSSMLKAAMNYIAQDLGQTGTFAEEAQTR